MSFPIDSQVICRFAFTNRPLTNTEDRVFQQGGSLPSAVGLDPAVVKFDYEPPTGGLVTLTGGSIDKDEVGRYHVVLPVAVSGSWRWRGYGQDDAGGPVAATEGQEFIVDPAFP